MKKLIKFTNIPVGSHFDWFGRICYKSRHLGEYYNAVHTIGTVRVMLHFPDNCLVQQVEPEKKGKK